MTSKETRRELGNCSVSQRPSRCQIPRHFSKQDGGSCAEEPTLLQRLLNKHQAGSMRSLKVFRWPDEQGMAVDWMWSKGKSGGRKTWRILVWDG